VTASPTCPGSFTTTIAAAQYTSISFTGRILDAGIDASIGATGDSYDNALAETINGLYKTELIKPQGPWRTADHVEIATLQWVDWFDHRRLYAHAATSRRQSSKPPITVTKRPGKPPSSQTSKSPETPLERRSRAGGASAFDPNYSQPLTNAELADPHSV
jgi:hypothetical protein